MSNKRKVFFDAVFSIAASAIPIAVLQIVVYPTCAKYLGDNDYGLLITIYSVWIMISNSLGNVLNNIRLLYNPKYEEKNLQGDFMLFFRNWSLANAVIISIATLFYIGKFSFLHISLSVLTSCLILTKAYLEVWFRIQLNYKYILINNILQSAGFLLGCFIGLQLGIWELTFLTGYLFSVIFCVLNTSLLREKKKKTEYYFSVRKDAYYLVGSSIIGNLMGYADKLILYPLMGGRVVSIYYTATILGKMITMLTGPINGVFLSYMARWTSRRDSVFIKFLTIGAIISSFGYFVAIVVSKPFMKLLYPQWYEEVMIYIPVTTATVAVNIMSSMLTPFVLKFCDMKWQIVISSVSAVVYFTSALILWKKYELMGFCIGTAVGAVAKLVIIIAVYLKRNEDFHVV